jgi:hypothetical protein
LLLNEIIVKREALSQKFSPSKIVGWQIQILNKEIASLTI